MQDRTITNALLALRAKIIRQGLEGRAHVEALLTLRGIVVSTLPRLRGEDTARRGAMRTAVLEALRDSPKPFREIVEHVAGRRGEIGYTAVYVRTGQALARMKRNGLVRREGRLWGI